MHLFLAVQSLHCCAWAFSSCGERGVDVGCSLLRGGASHRRGFSCCGAQAPGHAGSAAQAQALRRLSSCGTLAQVLHGWESSWAGDGSQVLCIVRILNH